MNGYVMPNEQLVMDSIDYLAKVLREPDEVPLEEAHRRVAAAVAILNAYTALRTWEKPVTILPAPEDAR